MSTASTVTCQIIRRKGYTYDVVAGIPSLPVPCDAINIQSTWWLVPYTGNGYFQNYIEVADEGTQPTPDSIHMLKVKSLNENDVYGIVIAPTDTLQKFQDLCNGCCGSTPTYPTVTIPLPIVFVQPNAYGSCPSNYQYNVPVPVLEAGQTFKISAYYNKYLLFTPSIAAQNFASVGAAVTWLNANWSNYGTWSADTFGNLQLISLSTSVTPVTQLAMTMNVTAATYCLTPGSAGQKFNALRSNGLTFLLGDGSLQDASNPQTIAGLITPALANSTVVIGGAGLNKVQVAGTDEPASIGTSVAGVGKGASFTIATIGAQGATASVTINSGGLGYVVGETFNGTGGSGNNLELTVASVSAGGVITGVTYPSPGFGYVVGDSIAAGAPTFIYTLLIAFAGGTCS